MFLLVPLPPDLKRTRAIFFSITLCVLFMLPSLTAGEQLSMREQPSLLPQQVLPLDPLTPDEIALAMSIAGADARVKESLGRGRHQFIQVQFVAIKSGADGKGAQEQEPFELRRHAAALFYRYDTDQGIYVVIDLPERSVGEITLVDGRSVPLAREEVSRALAVALRNRQVRTLLGPDADEFERAGRLSTQDGLQQRVEALRVIAASPRDPCYKHRCIELHFRKREGYVPAASVTVDLSAEKVKVQNTAR